MMMNSREFKLLAAVQIFTLVLVIILVVDRFAYRNSGQPAATSEAVGEALPATTEIKAIRTDPKTHQIFGDLRAPNTMVLYSRYNCDYCRDFHKVTDSLVANEVAQGKLKIVYKHFVNPGDTHGRLMARLAETAREAGFFEPVHRALMGTTASDSAALVQLALSAGLPLAEVRNRINAEEIQVRLNKDYEEGRANNINATPSFILNGRLFVGAISYQELRQHIDN